MKHESWRVVPCPVHTVYFAMTRLTSEAGAGQIETANNADALVQNKHEGLTLAKHGGVEKYIKSALQMNFCGLVLRTKNEKVFRSKRC